MEPATRLKRIGDASSAVRLWSMNTSNSLRQAQILVATATCWEYYARTTHSDSDGSANTCVMVHSVAATLDHAHMTLSELQNLPERGYICCFGREHDPLDRDPIRGRWRGRVGHRTVALLTAFLYVILKIRDQLRWKSEMDKYEAGTGRRRSACVHRSLRSLRPSVTN